MALSVFAVN